MKTYAETQGEKPFNWNAFLSKESYTVEECNEAYSLADSWVTCACGNMCEVIPRDVTGRPKDYILVELVVDFKHDVRDLYLHVAKGFDFKFRQRYAAHTFNRIEKRAAESFKEL